MTDLLVFHAARAGVGTSALTANTAASLAAGGRGVLVVDLNLSDGAQAGYFGLSRAQVTFTMGDFLSGLCCAEDAVYEVTARAAGTTPGRILVAPAGARGAETEPPDRSLAERLDELREAAARAGVAVMLVDAPAGADPGALAALSLADTAVIVMTADVRQTQGTGVAADVAEGLDVPDVVLAVNQVAASLEHRDLRHRLQQALGHPVVALVPYDPLLAAMNSTGLFVLQHPDDEVTQAIDRLAVSLAGRQDSTAKAQP